MKQCLLKSTAVALSLLVALVVLPTNAQPHYFDRYFVGSTPVYKTRLGDMRQDTSGAIWNGEQVILADDGGNDSSNVGTRIFAQLPKGLAFKAQFTNPKLLSRSVGQYDIEAASFSRSSYFLSSSMSLVDEESPGYRLLSEFTLDKHKQRLTWERSVDIRSQLVTALKDTCPYPGWHARSANVYGKRGGLNVEGLSVDAHSRDKLILGLRSPLCAADFGHPDFGEELSLRSGKAILVGVTKPFSPRPNFDFIQLDLNGHGVRGMEYVAALKGYVIIGGPVEKAHDYSLWLYRDDGKLEALKLNGFEDLCRPEAVTPIAIRGQAGIIVYSEQAGGNCSKRPFSFVAATIAQK